MKIRNSLLYDIKKNYVLAYEVASFFSKIINEDMSIDIDENEVGYLALHFGGALERMNIRKDRFKVINGEQERECVLNDTLETLNNIIK
jgi:lichenan operon transcriptional antiterminator